MADDDLRGLIARISTFDILTSIAVLGGALAFGLTTSERPSYLTAITVGALVAGAILCIRLLEPVFTGLARREAYELRRKIRPRWRLTVYFGMVFLWAVLIAPGADSFTGLTFNAPAAIVAMIAISNLAVAIYNLANQNRAAQRSA